MSVPRNSTEALFTRRRRSDQQNRRMETGQQSATHGRRMHWDGGEEVVALGARYRFKVGKRVLFNSLGRGRG